MIGLLLAGVLAEDALAADVVATVDAVAADTKAADASALLDTLRAERPALAAELAERGVAEEGAALLSRASPGLVDLLLPGVQRGPLPDIVGEDRRVDLVEADVRVEGTELVATVRGRGVVQNGVWLRLDTRGGPAPDMLLGFGRGWSREAVLDGGLPSPSLARETLPVVEADDTLSFRVDLAGSGRFDRAHAGSAVVTLKSLDGLVEEVAPGGVLGPTPEGAVDVLAAIVRAGAVKDADLAVALAVTFGGLRGVVAPEVTAVVDADAVGWLRYGEGLDAWLAERGADWSVAKLDALGKLVWAWPAAQGVAYGAAAMAHEAPALDLARYRFLVPDAAALARLRDLAPLHEEAGTTATAIDRQTWARLRYRARDDLMAALCRAEALGEDVCEGWVRDRKAGTDLGKLGERAVRLEEGVSATWQLDVLGREGVFVGDCATATALAIATMQAVGLPAIGMGWAGMDDTTPTHDVPLWYDGARFLGTQRGPAPAWARDTAFVYVTVPVVHPGSGFALAKEPGGWSRGGAVAGGWARYGDVAAALQNGVPGTAVDRWIDMQAAGGWPSW